MQQNAPTAASPVMRLNALNRKAKPSAVKSAAATGKKRRRKALRCRPMCANSARHNANDAKLNANAANNMKPAGKLAGFVLK